MTILCFASDGSGGFNLTETVDLLSCNGYAAQLATTLSGQPTLLDLFNVPISADLNQAFMLGIYTPLFAYLISWGYGTVINWFNEPENRH